MGTHMCHVSFFNAFSLWSLNQVTMQVLDTLNDIEHCLDALKHKVEIIRGDLTGDLYSVDILMTRKEAAAYIGRTVQSLDRLCRELKIKKTYINGQPRIRKSDLLSFKGIEIVKTPKPDSSRSELENLISRFK